MSTGYTTANQVTHLGISSRDERSRLHSSIAAQSSSKDDVVVDEENHRLAPSTWRIVVAPALRCPATGARSRCLASGLVRRCCCCLEVLGKVDESRKWQHLASRSDTGRARYRMLTHGMSASGVCASLDLKKAVTRDCQPVPNSGLSSKHSLFFSSLNSQAHPLPPPLSDAQASIA